MNLEQIKNTKKFFENVFLFVCGILIFTWLMWLSAYYLNNISKPHQIDWPSNPNVNTDTQLTPKVDPNLQNNKPTKRWRLNDNGVSQRYIYLEAEWREARMKELLSHYDRAPEYEVRKVVARIYQVYPEVLICIAYADTSLGNFLKTPNNVGNVGNNDRWQTKSMRTAEQWVASIWQTLTNQRLWDYISIDQLSRYWNADWKIYASSTVNRHNNVTNCLWLIRNKWVPDNFAFRW
jgi:hypothetical protein